MHQFIGRTSAERLLAGQQFIEDDTETENVATTIQPVAFPTCLFGAHVGRRPSNSAAAPQVILLPNRQPKVGDVGGLCAVLDEDVAGFDIPVDQPPPVRVMKRPSDNGQQSCRFFVARPIALDPITQRVAFDVLGNNIDRTVVGPSDIMDGNDIRMIQAGYGASFSKVGCRILQLLKSLGRRNLDSHLSLEFLVESKMDPSVSTLAQHSDQSVSANLFDIDNRSGNLRMGGHRL